MSRKRSAILLHIFSISTAFGVSYPVPFIGLGGSKVCRRPLQGMAWHGMAWLFCFCLCHHTGVIWVVYLDTECKAWPGTLEVGNERKMPLHIPPLCRAVEMPWSEYEASRCDLPWDAEVTKNKVAFSCGSLYVTSCPHSIQALYFWSIIIYSLVVNVLKLWSLC